MIKRSQESEKTSQTRLFTEGSQDFGILIFIYKPFPENFLIYHFNNKTLSYSKKLEGRK